MTFKVGDKVKVYTPCGSFIGIIYNIQEDLVYIEDRVGLYHYKQCRKLVKKDKIKQTKKGNIEEYRFIFDEIHKPDENIIHLKSEIDQLIHVLTKKHSEKLDELEIRFKEMEYIQDISQKSIAYNHSVKLNNHAEQLEDIKDWIEQQKKSDNPVDSKLNNCNHEFEDCIYTSIPPQKRCKICKEFFTLGLDQSFKVTS